MPISAYWDLRVGGSCVNQLASSVGSSIPHIITDGLLLLLPIVLVWTSQMPKAQRITLCAVFGLGGL